jgi:hypothetical protein
LTAGAEGFTAVLHHYDSKGRKSKSHAEARIENHLTPFFGNRLLSSISDADVQAYTASPLQAGAAGATVNRELRVQTQLIKARMPRRQRGTGLRSSSERVCRSALRCA